MILLSACGLCAALALAPSPSPSPSSSPLPEIAHVTTSDRSDETLNNATRTTYVVTRSELVRNGYRTIGEALQDVPALNVLSYGPLGANVNYGIRGSESAQVLVLVDGLPAPGSFDNTVELGNLPATGVERIEIVEGGGSTLYGSGAVGGIINVITQRVAAAAAALEVGSFGERRLELDTPHVQIARTIATNAYALPDGSVRPDSDYASSAVHAGISGRLGSFDVVLRAGLESDRLGAPGSFGFESPTSREADVNANANVVAVRKGAQSETTVQLGAARQQIAFGCDAATDPNCFLAGPSFDTENRVDVSARDVVAAANSQLLYGVDLSRGTVRSDTGSAVSVNALAQAAAYVQRKIRTAWGSWYYGARGERDGSLGGEISPSAGVLVRLSNDASLKVNAATAFRAPNASELYFPGYGNPALAPERSQVWDASISDARVLGGLSLGWFANRTRDLIVATPVKAGGGCEPDPSSFTYEACNIGRTLVQGFTLEMRTSRYRGFAATLNLTNLYLAQNLDTNTRMPNQPPVTANVRLDYTAHGPSVLESWGVWVHTSGARGVVDPSQPLFYQPAPYTTVNAYLRVRAGGHGVMALRGYNLGNERYAAVGGYPMPGRSFAVELSAK